MQSIFFAYYMFRNTMGFINGCKVKCEERVISLFLIVICVHFTPLLHLKVLLFFSITNETLIF